MPKKGKVGKGRKDKFYHLAKETGFRARSAFKLIQLNRKFGFLQESRVCLDLCAAPGGWLQVAAKHMPMSSIIIGVDLVAIKPIKGVTTFQSDITTDQCRQLIKKEIKTWKIDVVLNDGAPNVGSAWVQDAFTQAQLALSALKLACDFLRKGGWFITKVFRSKDYSALMWVFQQLFKKVHSTKPQASRNESAEIFVVCQGYLAPDKLDEKFLDPKHVFKEVSQDTKIKLNILHPEKTTRHREGYPENNPTMHTTVTASEFLNTKDAVEMLSTTNQIKLDEEIANNPLTTQEVKLCCDDIKLLGKREIKLLFTWRKKMRKAMKIEEDEEEKKEEPMEEEEKEMTAEEKEKALEEEIQNLTESEAKALKNKRRKVREERKKIREKLANKMSAAIETNDEMDMFSLKVLNNRKDLEAIEANAENMDTGEDLLESDVEQGSEVDLGEGSEAGDSDSDAYIYGDDQLYERPSRKKKEEGESEEIKAKERSKKKRQKEKEKVSGENPLLTNLEDEDNEAGEEVDLETKVKATKAALWYQKDIFKGIEGDEDDEFDMEQIMEKAGNKRKVKFDEETKAGDNDDDDDDDDDDSDSDEDLSTDEEEDDRSVAQTGEEQPAKKKTKGEQFEVVPQQAAGGYLNPHALALGTAMATSKKRKRDIIDDAYNRYAYGKEDGLPSWFVEDESKHRYRHLPVTKEEVEFYKQRQREINARPIKKVIEAQAKKKDKMLKKLEKVRKKADGILEASDVSEKEKASQLKGVYKRAGLLGKKREKVTYVVAKKSQAGKNYKRPDGLKGQYKVVDPRLKKDLRAAKNKEKTKGRKGKKGKGR